MTRDATNPHGSAFHARLGWGRRPAFLSIDLVHAYTDPDGPFALPDVNQVITTTASLAAAARAVGCPVIWTVVRYENGLAEAGMFAKKVPGLTAFAPGAPRRWCDLSVAPEPEDLVVRKHFASAFFGTGLAQTLQDMDVDTLVIGGVSTSGCVRATATDAISLGFRPLVVRDACGDRSSELHERNLADMDAKCADVIGIGDALDGLGRLGRFEDTDSHGCGE